MTSNKNEKNAQSYTKGIESLRQEILTNRTEIAKEITNKIDACETRILSKLEKLNKRITELESKNENLKVKVETIEWRAKKNNVLIFGLKYDKISLNILQHPLKSLLDIDINVEDINNFCQLGNSGN